MKKLFVIMAMLASSSTFAAEFTICINGYDLQGRPCGGQEAGFVKQNGFGSMNNYRPTQIVAQGTDAMEIIVNSTRIVTGVDASGSAHFIGPYKGDRFPKIRDEFFSCTVSKEATTFKCVSWMPGRI